MPLAHEGMLAVHAVVGADEIWGLLARLRDGRRRPASSSCPSRSCCHDRRCHADLRRVRLAELHRGRAQRHRAPRHDHAAASLRDARHAPSSRQVRTRRRRGAPGAERSPRWRPQPGRRRSAAPPLRIERADLLRARDAPCRPTSARPWSTWRQHRALPCRPGAGARAVGRRRTGDPGWARLARARSRRRVRARWRRRVSLVAADERHPGAARRRRRVRRRQPRRAATGSCPLPCWARPA